LKQLTLNTILLIAFSVNCFAQFGADYSSYGFNFVNDTYNDGLKGWTGSNLTNPSVDIYRQDALNNYALRLNPTNETLNFNYDDCGYMDLNPCTFIVNLRVKVNQYTGSNDKLSFLLFSGAKKVELDLTSSGIFYTNNANVSTQIPGAPIPPINQWQTYTINVNGCTGNATLMIENDGTNLYPLNLPNDSSPQNINLSASTDAATPFSAEVDHLFIYSEPVKFWLGQSTAFVDDTPAGYQNTTGDRQHFLCLPNGESIGVNENGGGYITFTELMPGGANLDPRPKYGSGGTKTIRSFFNSNEYNPVQAGISSESGGHLVNVSVTPDKRKVTVDTFPLYNFIKDAFVENTPLVYPDGTTLGEGIGPPLVLTTTDNDVYDEFGIDMRHELMSEIDFHTCIEDITRCGEISTVRHSAEWEYIRHPSHVLQFHEVTNGRRPNFGGSLGSDNDLGEMRHKFEIRLNRDLGYEYVLWKDANNVWQNKHLTSVGDFEEFYFQKDTPKNQRFMVFSTSLDPDAPGGVAFYYPESAFNCNSTLRKSRNNKALINTEDRRYSFRFRADWRKTNWMRLNLYIRNEGLIAPNNAHQLFGTPNEIMMEVLSYCEETIATANVMGGTFCAGTANFSLSGTPNTIVTYNIDGGPSTTVALNSDGMATVATSNAATMNM